jgi:hypothetical protein
MGITGVFVVTLAMFWNKTYPPATFRARGFATTATGQQDRQDDKVSHYITSM